MFTNSFVQGKITNEHIIEKHLTVYNLQTCFGGRRGGDRTVIGFTTIIRLTSINVQKKILENPVKRKQKLVFNMQFEKKTS